MTISVSLVKDLREKTGAGMMDCKKALVDSNGDFEAAIDLLRKSGLAAAAKKTGRIAAEGLTAIAVDGTKGAIIEINSETDFVSRNSSFQELVKDIAEIALTVDNLDLLKTAKIKSGKSVEEEITANIAVIGENLTLRRMQLLSVNAGVIASYVHNASAENMGAISVLVALESTGDKAKLMQFGKQLAMHIAAAKPQTLDVNSVAPEMIEREKEIFTAQAKAAGKPDNIIEKMIEGRVRKFFEEIVLLEQIFVIDGKSKISALIESLAKEIDAPVEIKTYARFEVGEGIEKETQDFAAEVAAVAGK